MADALALALQKRKEKVSKSGKYLDYPWLVKCESMSRMMLTLVEKQMMKMMVMIGTKCPIPTMTR